MDAMNAVIDSLKQLLAAEDVQVAAPMSAHTTFKIGGPAQVLVTPRTVEQIQGVFAVAKAANVPVRVMGLGSNILVSDAGLEGIVVKLAENFSAVEIEGQTVRCQAGASNEAVARKAQQAGLAGYEFASGIPGTIGGAAIMNAGAYGGEFKDVAQSVACLTPEGRVVEVPASQANWGYRHSMMMDAGYVVLGATLKLQPDDQAAIQERMDDLAKRRQEKQPLEMPSAGSTFKRPEGYFAGKLIQDAGLRGYQVGGAQVSTKHTGFVVNAGGATAADVLQLISDVQQRVLETQGVTMEPEVRMWGF